MTMGIQQLMWKLEGLHTAYHEAVYVRRDPAAAAACLTDDVVVTHVPAGTGATGAHDVLRHLAEDVVPHLPADLTFRRVTRTVDQRRLVEESVVAFTHDREVPWLLPGVPPTGRPAEVLAITVVTARHRTRLGETTTQLAGLRTLWDHTGLVVQLGLDLWRPAAREAPAAS